MLRLHLDARWSAARRTILSILGQTFLHESTHSRHLAYVRLREPYHSLRLLDEVAVAYHAANRGYGIDVLHGASCRCSRRFLSG